MFQRGSCFRRLVRTDYIFQSCAFENTHDLFSVHTGLVAFSFIPPPKKNECKPLQKNMVIVIIVQPMYMRCIMH